MRIPEHHRALVERMKAEQGAKAAAAEAAEADRQKFLEAYPALREGDIRRALSRRISTGEIGLPFLLIDSVFAVAVTGSERGQNPNLQSALEDAKDQLWQQCRHLGGDAVLYADFRIEHGAVAFTNGFAVAWNFVFGIANSVSRMNVSGMDTKDRQSTITVFAQGTAVRLVPPSTQLDPRIYERFDINWLDMRLPPNIAAS
jgi:uncharacterized protein YbjQ (UPF0145 family)